ncbi:MAG: hypothetical protein NZT61_02665 [Deltaproteobacteria bacterium]|nr:hypothetical protein [Deltaproteobacteria bacterium]
MGPTVLENVKTPFVFQGEVGIIYPTARQTGIGMIGLGPCVGVGLRFKIINEKKGDKSEILALAHFDAGRDINTTFNLIKNEVEGWCKKNGFKVDACDIYLNGGQVWRDTFGTSAKEYLDIVTCVRDLRSTYPRGKTYVLELPLDRES